MGRVDYSIYIGKKFNRLTIVGVVIKNNSNYFHCICDCGNEKDIYYNNVVNNKTISCGCYRNEQIIKKCYKHGEGGNDVCTTEYRTWRSMKRRCYNKNDPKYKSYGYMGIKVCDRWLNSYNNFLEDMGRKPKNKVSLDRIDNNGDYCPENCRWADRFEQGKNMRSNVIMTHNNESKILAEWSRCLNIPEKILQYRVKAGWSDERALTTPVRKVNK